MKCYVHSRGSAHSCVQLTGTQLQYMHTPQSQVSDPGVEPGDLLTLEDRTEG